MTKVVAYNLNILLTDNLVTFLFYISLLFYYA